MSAVDYDLIKRVINDAAVSGLLSPSDAVVKIAEIEKIRRESEMNAKMAQQLGGPLSSPPPWVVPPNAAASGGSSLGQLVSSPFAAKRYETQIGGKVRDWLDREIGGTALPYVQVVMFSARLVNRLKAEGYQWSAAAPPGVPLKLSGDADCVVMMQKPEGSSAAGAVLVLKVPESIIEQIISDEVREKMEGAGVAGLNKAG